MGTTPDNKLTLEWLKLADGRMALVFDQKTWAVYQDNAKALGKSAEQVIVTAVAGSLAPILVDNYALNRFTGR
jgi:hypothetical protein